VKKSLHFFSIPFIALCIAAYFFYSDAVKSFVFTQVQKLSTAQVQLDDILFIDGQFNTADYTNFINRAKTLENSVVLFMPQIYNTRLEDYIEEINPDEVKKTKDDYRNLTISLSEAQNIIPVMFVDSKKNTLKEIDLSGFAFYRADDIKMKIREYTNVNVASKRVIYTLANAGFYEDYQYLPFTIPVIIKYDNSALTGAAVEAIRKYYKFTRNRIKYTDRRLQIGDAIDFPMLGNGGIIIQRLKETPKVYTLDEFMALDNKTANDKIIIIKNREITRAAMFSLGTMTASIMKGEYIKYDPFLNYAGALLLLLGLLAAFRSFRLLWGILILAGAEAVIFFGGVLFMNQSIYLDVALLSVVNLLSFITVYYYRIMTLAIDRDERFKVLSQFMHPKSVRRFILKNRDIRIKNSWIKAYVIYIVFEEQGIPDVNEIKKNFEQASELVYNNHKEFIIKGHNNCDMVIVLLDESPDLRKILETVFVMREKLSTLKYNIILSETEIYIFENRNELGILDKKYAVRNAAQRVEKKKHIIVPEEDIQKYINFIKFQKIAGTGAAALFNITGFREESANEN
jgi:hypothetical protein